MHPGNQQQGVFLSSSFPHDSSSLSLAQQSELRSQYHMSDMPSSQTETSQSHYSPSSEISLLQLKHYDTESHKLKSQGLQSLEPQIRWSQLHPSQIQFAHLQLSQSHPPEMQPSQVQLSQSQTLQLDPLQLQPPQLQTPKLQTPQLQPQLQTPQLQTPQLQPQFQTPQLQTPQLQPPQLQTPQLQTPQLQTPQLQTPQLQTPQLQTPQLQTPQLQTPQLQTPQLQMPQLQTPLLQTPQLQESQLLPHPPPFWQHSDGSCWWGYYPIPYPPSPNATTSSLLSSLSSSPSMSPNYNPPKPYNIPLASYENYAYYTGCHRHRHHQDGNAFAYYHPFYDERLYAAVTAAAIFATNANGIPSSDAGASQRCTDLSSSSSSATSSCSSSSLNERTVADASSVLVAEASSCQLPASTPSTIRPRATASFPVPVFNYQPTKKLPGYDSNCNPCLERTERSCTTEPSIFRCPPVFVQRPAICSQVLPECRGVNARTRDPASTEPGPPPWVHDIKNSSKMSRLGDKGTEIVGKTYQSGSSVDQCNEAGWNLDGTIGIKNEPITCQLDERFNGTKLNGAEIDSGRHVQSHRHSEMDARRCNENGVTKIIEEAKPESNKNNIEENPIGPEDPVDKKSKEKKPKRSGNDVEASKVGNARWNGSAIVPGRNDRSSDVVPQKWNRIDNASRNLYEIDPSIPMNILHEERNANESPVVDKVKNNDGRSFDRSEDTNATDSDSDSEIDTASNDSSVDVEPVCMEHATNTYESDSESDSDDSDSYLAYSTGLNPHEKVAGQSNLGTAVRSCADDESKKTAVTMSEDAVDERSLAVSSDRLNATDCESFVEDDDDMTEDASTDDERDTNLADPKAEIENALNRLSVIPEDGEQNTIGSDGWQNVAEDRSADLTTVSVSLPLRFRFSVAESEGDVTNVIVNGSTVKTETSNEGEDDDVSVHLKLADDAYTSADFTLRRSASRETDSGGARREPVENHEVDFWETEDKTLIGKEETPRNESDDAISRSNSKTLVAQDDCIDFWETITSGRVSPDLNYSTKRKTDRVNDFSWEVTGTKRDEEEVVRGDDEENLIDEENTKVDDSKEETEETEENEEDEEDEEDEEEEENEEEEESEADEDPEDETSKRNDDEESPKNATTPLFELTEAKNDDSEESNGRSNLENSKHLLSIQNSRDETDDEDSGVTSDMSRLISEVDTDSECAPTRKMSGYKRTQTHSRLFRLLSREDDGQASEEVTTNTLARRDRLSLPLKSSGFSYDEGHHCSNYSSGLTSPDYSPVHDGAWRRLHGDDNGPLDKSNGPGEREHDDDASKNQKDPYFENWKRAVNDNTIREEKIDFSKAFKIVDCGGSPNWRFRTNVLCPRIKSSKNVPRTVRNNRSAKPVISSSPTSNSFVKSNDKTF